MAFPAEKYNYIIARREDNKPFKVIALSTYEGRVVRGVAKCDPRDEFDLEYGKQLAAARCNYKIAQKRAKRAAKHFAKAKELMAAAQQILNDKFEYNVSAGAQLNDAYEHLKALKR